MVVRRSTASPISALIARPAQPPTTLATSSAPKVWLAEKPNAASSTGRNPVKP